MTKTLADLATVLQTTEKNVQVRARAMRIGDMCHRCGGSGRYSFNGCHSVCYRCNGACVEPVTSKNIDRVYANAVSAVENGALTEYLNYLAATKIAKNAQQILMAAWKETGISDAYDWRKAVRAPEGDYHGDLSAINKKMCNAYDVAVKASYKLNPRSETYFADVIALEALVNEGLAKIAAAKIEMDERIKKG